MPGPYTTLNARVKQKIATEADWLAVDDTLGPIFEGEQCFVFNDAGVAVNFKIGDGTKKFSELPYFIAYYAGVISQKILSYIGKTGNFTIPSVFRNMSEISELIFINNSGGDVTLKVGTSVGGNDVFELVLPIGVNSIGLKKYFTTASTLYFTGLTGINYSIFILYNQLDEAPVMPPSGSGGPSFVYGTVYAFKPMYTGHEDDVWDFTTGLGIAGEPYENCILFNTNDLPDLSHTYLTGYGAGDTLGGDYGAETVNIAKTHLPASGVGMFVPYINANGGQIPGPTDRVARARNDNYSGPALNYEIVSGPDNTQDIGVTAKLGDGTGLPVKPKSIIVLYFTGPQ
jgi:hypothetical protein